MHYISICHVCPTENKKIVPTSVQFFERIKLLAFRHSNGHESSQNFYPLEIDNSLEQSTDYDCETWQSNQFLALLRRMEAYCRILSRTEYISLVVENR